MVVLKVGTYVDVVDHAGWPNHWGMVKEVILGRQVKYLVGGGNIGEVAVVFNRDELSVINLKSDATMFEGETRFLVPAYIRAAYVAQSTQPAPQETAGRFTSTEVTSIAHSELTQGEKRMVLTKKGTSKNGKITYYSGAGNPLRFSNAAFIDKIAPDTFEVPDGIFTPPKVVLTKEERKAARAARPTLSAAEKAAKKVARLEARLTALRAEAAKDPETL